MDTTSAKVAADGSVATLKPGSPTEIVEGAAANERNERSTLLAGLLAPTPRISQVYLYDARGSELYEEIVRAPEYYLPDTESVLLAAHAAEIVAPSIAAPLASQAVIELGAGAGERRQGVDHRQEYAQGGRGARGFVGSRGEGAARREEIDREAR